MTSDTSTYHSIRLEVAYTQVVHLDLESLMNNDDRCQEEGLEAKDVLKVCVYKNTLELTLTNDREIEIDISWELSGGEVDYKVPDAIWAFEERLDEKGYTLQKALGHVESSELEFKR